MALEVPMDLRIRICDESGMELTSELYAKVIERHSAAQDVYLVHFTSVPEQVVPFFEERAAAR
jgi:hypothetical protein